MPTIDRILKQLISEDLNLIEFQGSRKTGGYVLTEKGKAFIKSMNDNMSKKTRNNRTN
jgi:ATP-dependent DNA helicase RecG